MAEGAEASAHAGGSVHPVTGLRLSHGHSCQCMGAGQPRPCIFPVDLRMDPRMQSKCRSMRVASGLSAIKHCSRTPYRVDISLFSNGTSQIVGVVRADNTVAQASGMPLYQKAHASPAANGVALTISRNIEPPSLMTNLSISFTNLVRATAWRLRKYFLGWLYCSLDCLTVPCGWSRGCFD
jgi:hypothetical protein